MPFLPPVNDNGALNRNMVNERYRRSRNTLFLASREKEGHILCDFRFSSSFQEIDMILLTRPEGGVIGRTGLI